MTSTPTVSFRNAFTRLLWCLTVVLTSLVFGRTCHAADLRVLTVCDALRLGTALNGESIVLVGWLSSTPEGTWADQPCLTHVQTDGFLWKDTVHVLVKENISDRPTKLSPAELEAIAAAKQAVLSVASPNGRVEAVYGRIRTKKLRTFSCGKDLCGLGFGHMGWAPIQIEVALDYLIADSGKK